MIASGIMPTTDQARAPLRAIRKQNAATNCTMAEEQRGDGAAKAVGDHADILFEAVRDVAAVLLAAASVVDVDEAREQLQSQAVLDAYVGLGGEAGAHQGDAGLRGHGGDHYERPTEKPAAGVACGNVYQSLADIDEEQRQRDAGEVGQHAEQQRGLLPAGRPAEPAQVSCGAGGSSGLRLRSVPAVGWHGCGLFEQSGVLPFPGTGRLRRRRPSACRLRIWRAAAP